MELKTFTLTPFATNCYVVIDGGEALVVDPGEPAPALLQAIEGLRVPMIFNTHCHLDHSNGNAALVEATGAPLVCHADELPLLQALPQQGAMFGVPATPSPEPDRFTQPGEQITVGATTLEVRFTPGHSPGHVVLVGDGFVLAGDTLFAGSIGRTDLPGGDTQTLLDSIQRELMSLPDDTIVYCGHGPATTIGEERHTNPFLNMR